MDIHNIGIYNEALPSTALNSDSNFKDNNNILIKSLK
jgi:hypothetical protein